VVSPSFERARVEDVLGAGGDLLEAPVEETAPVERGREAGD
jgi:hypothetical protein